MAIEDQFAEWRDNLLHLIEYYTHLTSIMTAFYFAEEEDRGKKRPIGVLILSLEQYDSDKIKDDKRIGKVWDYINQQYEIEGKVEGSEDTASAGKE